MSAIKRIPSDPAADRGTTGPAMLARRAALEVVEDDTAAEDGSRRFTRTEVLRVRDTAIDWCEAKGWLHGYRRDAAIRLAELYHDGRNAPTGYSGSGTGGNGEMSDERAEAWAAYCAALDAIPRRCQDACMDVARGRLPTDANAHRNVPDGFAALVVEWKMGPRG